MKKIKNLKLKIKNCQRGFTLIELLIVIAIIGVLSALLMANFVGIRQRSRDAQRKSDVRQIQSALEFYRSDNGIYPLTAALSSCGVDLSLSGVTYMSKIPCDPSTGADYIYRSATGSTYTLRACLENANDSQKDTNDTCGPLTTYSYTVSNP
ncbi:MAG: hypothetical protein A2171_01895 [Candidatus Levybacteria bacterium RBG_13_35_9]|nr:MAG: hypothetical protein A2171_01895 [Candidatus Levybacteria bacterium RBG_13_35_9]